MKVLHLTNNYPTKKYPIYGIFVKEQIDSLTSLGIENEVYLINGRENGKVEYIKQIRALNIYLKDNKYDIIHCHHALSALTLFLSGYNSKNVIISFQNDPLFELGLFLFKYLRYMSVAQIFKNNSKLLRYPSSHYIPNGVNLKLFYPISKNEACEYLGIDSKRQYILFVSSNYSRKQKRQDIFDNVFKHLRSGLGLTNIHPLYLFNEAREKIPYYFNASSLHLLTSDFEGSPNSVKEAMACNVPVVSTNVGNVKELLNGIKGSFVSNTHGPLELAELVYKSLQNTNALNSREYLKRRKLDIESVAENILEIYKGILSK